MLLKYLMASIIIIVFSAHGNVVAQTFPIDSDRSLVIGVVKFSSTTSIDGETAAGLFSTQLARSSKLTVVERSQLDKLLADQRFDISGFVDEATVKESGKLLGTTHLLMGEITSDANLTIIAIRLVDGETGEVVFSDQAITDNDAYYHTIINMGCDLVYKLTGEMPSLGGEAFVPLEMLEVIGRNEADPNKLFTKSAYRLKVDVNKEGDSPVYHVGESISLSVKPERDCYLYIFNISKTGGVKVIFPNQSARDNLVKQGEIVQFPPKGAHYKWTLGEPAEGLEYIVAIATDLPIEFVPGFSKMLADEDFPTIASDSGGFLTKQINVTLIDDYKAEYGIGFVRFYLAQ